MKEEQTLKVYLDRYWELYNKIGGNNAEVTTWTFKVKLPIDSKLRTSLTLHMFQNLLCSTIPLGITQNTLERVKTILHNSLVMRQCQDRPFH